MVERKDPARVFGFDSEEAVQKFVEQDFLIRSGMCPNGHGLLSETSWGQQCGTCGFATNTRAEVRRDS